MTEPGTLPEGVEQQIEALVRDNTGPRTHLQDRDAVRILLREIAQSAYAEGAAQERARIQPLTAALHRLEAAEAGDDKGWVNDDDVDRATAVFIHEAVKFVTVTSWRPARRPHRRPSSERG
jgi:hypothetical protein